MEAEAEEVEEAPAVRAQTRTSGPSRRPVVAEEADLAEAEAARVKEGDPECQLASSTLRPARDDIWVAEGPEREREREGNEVAGWWSVRGD